ncbi:MAG: gliding motility-associated lipoprotein [Bacteroidetes bacterium RIFCSPLOWO2_12_FULL_35_15]|nr:MAG: gliding motility-associated lipoprotein [Bacteroidetes bacterium RIFCSPLOWO2_12_FULL_35_15]
MKKLLLLGSLVAVLGTSCVKSSGELVGVHPRTEWFDIDPFGMLYIPMGSYNMGPDDEDNPYAHTTKSKTVSIQAFYIDQTEISNNEYRQFVYWVRDSIAHRALFEDGRAEHGVETDDYDQPLDPPLVNFEEPIGYDEQDVREVLEFMYLPPEERFYRRREIDTRKLNYEYYWINLRLAAQKSNRFKPSKTPDEKTGLDFINGYQNTSVGDAKTLGHYDVKDGISDGSGKYSTRERKDKDRSVFIVKDVINVYPDTLAWVHDFTYSFNEPMTNMYFWHSAYDDYPVVGVTWKQARSFCVWRTQLFNNWLLSNGQSYVNDFRLPTESEWEYAARGGLSLSPYPWGGPYIRNALGCFLGNFKPMRGSYIDDGGFHTVKIESYNPNDYGLYCMAGNAAEWTSNAFDEAAYDFDHDLNPDYVYEAQDNEANVLKRKVIRGGSWKDVGYYLQTSTRTYEYQDTAKCYIGFRCVQTYLGRAKGDVAGPGGL